MNIKMVELHGQYVRLKPEIDEAIQRVLESTSFINGPEVELFANSLSSYLGGCHVIPCANGTDALQIAMMALGLRPGDEVILPVHTYVATAEVIALLGLKPVFVDVDARSFNIDVDQVADKITDRTRAIVPVHLYGQCAPMDEILTLAEDTKMVVIEDAAQALGGECCMKSGLVRKAGAIGTVGATSFFPSKNLGCFGDGGALMTNDGQLAEKIRMIANHGQRVKYIHDLVGVNSRLDTLQAAVLSVKLKYLDDFSQRRNKVASFYDQHLGALEEVKIPYRQPGSTHVFHQYTLRVQRRDELKAFLNERHIPSMIYYPVPLHLQPAYKKYGNGESSFPVSERLAKEVISLPIHTEMTTGELEYIVKAIQEFYQ